MDLFNNKGFLCVDTTESDKVSDSLYYCYFAYQHGELSYIGYGTKDRINHCTNEKGYVVDFMKDTSSVIAYKVAIFQTNEEAKLFETHYINKLKPKQNKHFCKVSSYGLHEQKRFIPDGFELSCENDDSFLISLLHNCKIDHWVICKMFNCDEKHIKTILNKKGVYGKVLHPFEFADKDGRIVVDKPVCQHYKTRLSIFFEQAERIYMKIGDF